MKKFLLISFIGIALVGCAEEEKEKKVTNEMLVGEWKCDSSEFQAGWKDGHFQDYSAPKVIHQKVKYFMNNDAFMVIFDENRPLPFDLEKILKANNQELKNDKVKIKTTTEFNYVNDDEYNFKQIRELSLVNATEKEQIDNNHKQEINLACTRVKVN
ncbi:hypothetical protein [uncultured Gilliamella sp.]|uniref:hypothetical protein n=1 Tax=uncultured Gilliamella sp. TaxID=1193505 RepID=UPI0025EFAB2B|nr:hypothetical protein [uncultured Gilliamella sp.]